MNIQLYEYAIQTTKGRNEVEYAWANTPRELTQIEKKNFREQILKLLKKKKAVLIAHYYVDADIQDLALESGGCVSDSLEMARFGSNHSAKILVVAGVRFMGETAKILNPEKIVLMPDLKATCSLDLSCPIQEFQDFCDLYPDREVVVYANTSAAVKARANWMVTSSCALAIISFLKKQGKKILWAPDKHLGNYIFSQTGADMILWKGNCIVHDEFKAQELKILKEKYPEALVLSHPESPIEVIALSNIVGSTSQIIQAVIKSSAKDFIIATDNGILHRIKQLAPHKNLIEAPTADKSATCKSCAHCPWMAMNGLEGILHCLQTEENQIHIDSYISIKAKNCIEKMLKFVRDYPDLFIQTQDGFVKNIGAA